VTPNPSLNWTIEELKESMNKKKNAAYLDLPGDGVSFLQFGDDVHPVRDIHIHSRVHLRHAKQKRAEYISMCAFW
jgi:hypothetical protein